MTVVIRDLRMFAEAFRDCIWLSSGLMVWALARDLVGSLAVERQRESIYLPETQIRCC